MDIITIFQELPDIKTISIGKEYLVVDKNDRPKISKKGKVNPKNSFSISIEDEPKIVAGQSNITAKELKKIFEWIKKNKDVLVKHANMEITDRQLRSGIKKEN